MNKKITIEIPDDIYADIKRSLYARGMSGSAFGCVDGFVKAMIDHIEKGDEYWMVFKHKIGE